MTKIALSPKPHIANCVGAGCPERDMCLRYLRPAFRPHKDRDTGKVVVQQWASFNIERAHFGDCRAEIEARGIAAEVARANATHVRA